MMTARIGFWYAVRECMTYLAYVHPLLWALEEMEVVAILWRFQSFIPSACEKQARSAFVPRLRLVNA